MKAIVWLWPIVTLACCSSFVCVYAQLEFQNYAEFPTDNNLIQDYLAERNKRSKPSLSIVNPIDVLRQRLLLEIARRQMKENSKQVELNRQYLKNIGKRGITHKQQLQHQTQQEYPDISDQNPSLTIPISSSSNLQLQQIHQQQLQQHQQQQQELKRKHLQQLEKNSNNKLFDFLRQQHQQQQQQQNQHHQKQHHDINGNSIGIGNGDIDNSALIVGNFKENTDMSDNEINENNNNDDDDDDDDYQMRYLYRLQKNRFPRE